MRRNLGFILAMVLLVLTSLTLTAVPAQASAGSPLADTRERLNGVIVQLQTFDNVCVIILAGLIKEIDIDVLEGRKLITVGKGNLSNLLLDGLRSAASNVSRVTDTLEQCRSLLGTKQDGNGDGTIFGELNAVVEEIADLSSLDDRKRNKINGLLENIALGNLSSIEDRLDEQSGSLTGKVEEASTIVDDLIDGLDSTDPSCGEVTRDAATLVAVPQLTETGPFSFETLRCVKIDLGLAHQDLTQALRDVKRITGFKKWVFKALREIIELLRNTTFGGHGASEPAAGVTQIYSMNGVLVRTQINGLGTSDLANGIYLAVTRFADQSGRVRYETKKFVVVH
ncbi:hypothetical protein HYR54_07955 [Candidatus Acetothermia bacterium]|nr:hypothetical protein [Candidatus Acetothermia bacterium]